MSSISDPGVSLPDFDDQLRAQEAAARAAEFDILKLTLELDHPLAESINTALTKLIEQHKGSRELSVNINAHYKRSKREIEARKATVKTCNEKLEKCVQEKKHTLTTAKEYRVTIKILERKFIEKGGSLEEERKRPAEEIELKKFIGGGPLIIPAQKRVRTGSGSSDEHPNTPSTAPTEVFPRNTPPHLSTSPKRPAVQRRHFTPVPKTKPANFAKYIPLGQERKFASTRMATPNRLHDPTRQSSHATAVFQGLAASIKAHEVWADLDDAEKQAPDLPLLDLHLTVGAIMDEVVKRRSISRTKALVDFIAASQKKHVKPLNAYGLQRHLFRGPKQPDTPAKYLEYVFSGASAETLTEAFKAPHRYFHECSECNGKKAYEHHEFDPRDPKPVVEPTLETEPGRLTNLRPGFDERELRRGKTVTRDLNSMLFEKTQDPEYVPCKNCKGRNFSKLKKTWEGYSYAPENLSFSFERGHDTKYKLTLPIEHDFKTYIHGAKEEVKYRLVTVMKKLEKTGMYAAFVHAEDGRWWRCINDEVKKCEIEDWQADGRNGETVLAMYEKLE